MITELKDKENEYISNNRLLLAETLHDKCQAAIFVNLSKNKYRVFHYDKKIGRKIDYSGSYSKLVEDEIKLISDAASKLTFHSAFDREALIEIFKEGCPSVKLRYKQLLDDGEEHWAEIQNMLISNNNDEIKSVVVWRNIDDDIAQERKALEEFKAYEARQKTELRKRRQIIDILVAEYSSVYYIDIEKDSMTPYLLNEKIDSRLGRIFHSGIKYSETPIVYAESFVYPDDQRMFLQNTSIVNLMQELKNKKAYTFNFRSDMNQYYEVKFVKIGNDTDRPKEIVVGFANKDAELHDKLEKERVWRRDVDIIQVLASEYSSVYYVDLSTDELTTYTMNEETENKLGKIFRSGISFTEAFGLYVERFVDLNDRDVMLHAGSIYNIIKELSGKKSFTTVYRSSSSGELHYCEMKFVKVGSEQGVPRAVALGFADKNEELMKEKKYQEDMAEAMNKAEAASRAKTQFLFNISHDIRTPLNAILGFTDIAAKNLADKDILADCLEKVKVSGQHLLRLVNEVLDMSQIESGKIIIEEEKISISEASEELIEIAKRGSAGRDISIRLNLGKIQNDSVLADKLHLNQILINVISNAVKYTRPGGRVTYSIIQKPSAREGFGEFEFVVEDTGIGMSQHVLDHVFEQFVREGTVTTSGIEGAGLGMSIVKKLVELMHGTIEVESELGIGTKVTINLELRLAPIQSEAKTDNIAADWQGKFHGKRVLIAEDNELNREIAKFILEDEGITVEEADDGSTAVQMVKENRPDYYDFVLMDIQMPYMDGHKATQAIRALKNGDYSHLPIIALSANAFEEDRRKSAAAGMNDHVAKPIDTDELFGTMIKYIAPMHK